MARKARKSLQDSSSNDDAPEVVSKSTSKADAKRAQKALQDFQVGEKARRKARNRERDQKLKERARVTKSGKTEEKLKGVRFMGRALKGEYEEESGEDDADDELEARMLRAMRDAAGEVESDEGKDEDEFRGFGQEMGSDSSSAQYEDDGDTRTSLAKRDSIHSEAPMDDEEMDEGEEATLPRANMHRRSKRADYLADDLFAAAFAPQNSKPALKKSTKAAQQETVRKRRRKSSARPKDLVIGGRTIRTLPQPSDSRSQATARTIPSARARKFMDQSLAMNGTQELLKAKKRGWERRPANVGVMKSQGAPHGFARSRR